MVASKSRRWRWPLFVLGGLLGSLLLLSALLHTSLLREQVRKQVNLALAPLFQGKIQIERLGRLGLWGVGGVDARVFDPEGRQVIRVQGLEARAALPELGWQLVFGGNSPTLNIDVVRIDYADVTLREDEDLGVTLARSFLAVETAQPQPEAPSDGELELRINAIELRRVWAHGRVSGSPALDADLLELRAQLSQTAAGFALELERSELSTRGLPGAAEPGGTVWGSIDVPSDDALPLRLEGYLDGQAAHSPLWLETTWLGDELYGQVRLPRLPASYVNQQISGLILQGELAVRAEVQGTLPELELVADLRGDAAHVALGGTAFLSDGLEAAVSLTASGVNLAQLVEGAPASDLRARADALLFEVDEDQFAVAHRVEIADGRLAGMSTPLARVSGRLDLPATGGLNARGSWHVAESGADLRGQYSAALHDHAADFVAVSVQGRLDEPARLGALGVKTSGSLRGQGELRPKTGQLNARLELDLSRLEYQTFQARSVDLQAQATGSLHSPRVHAAATVELLSGRAHADVSYSEQLQEASLFLADIDLHRLASAFGAKLPFEQGNLNLDARARREGKGEQPFVVDGKLHADFGRVGSLRVTANGLEVPGDLRGPRQLTQLQGELVAKGSLDLSQATRLSSMLGLPLERATGKVRFELSGRQAKGDPRGPELSLLVVTNGLRMVEQRVPDAHITTTAEAIDNKPVALEGIDAHAALRFLPSTGEAIATVILRDRGGTLLMLEGEAQLGGTWPTALAQPHALLTTPIKLHAEVPQRRIQSLPPLLRLTGLRGRLALDAELVGTLADPRVRAWITLDRLRTQRGDETVDMRANVRYAPEAGELFATARDRRGADLASLTTRWQGDLRRALQQRDRPALVGSVQAELFGFPLELVPMLAEQQVKGRITGRASLHDWGKDAHLEASFEGRNLSVGTASLPSLKLIAHNRAGKLLAELGVSTGKGAARASLQAEAAWGARPLPQLERRGVLKVSAQRFELGTLSPLLGAYVSELSGMLDADAQVAVDGAATRVSGTARLQHGAVQLPALGQRFSDITARVAVRDNQFKLQELQARGLTGKLSVTGAARLDGFALRSADAHAIVKESEALPVTIEGAMLGDAWGSVKVSYLSPATGDRKLAIDVNEFHLITPETEGHGLQSLDNAEGIRIGTRRSDGAFVALPVQPLEPGDNDESGAGKPAQPLRITIKLGPNVTVARGSTAQAKLTGQLLAVSNGETTLTGRIEVKGGKLDVQGKTFEIERGVVTFDGRDASNPTITATARWDAPEHTVYAEYVGDVKDGRIKLRAEPPLTQDEIASLVLFGDPDGSVGGSDPNTAALAVSVAGDTAAKGLNQAVSDFTNLDVRARVDTTTGSARPELALQVSPRVATKVTRAIGEPGVGESPDRTFLTLELRLRRAWALSAVFGDHGASALDLIWRHRY